MTPNDFLNQLSRFIDSFASNLRAVLGTTSLGRRALAVLIQKG